MYANHRELIAHVLINPSLWKYKFELVTIILQLCINLYCD